MEDTKLNITEKRTMNSLQPELMAPTAAERFRATTGQTGFGTYPPESALLYETQPA